LIQSTHPPSLSKFTPFCFVGFSSSEDILLFTTRPVPIPWANLSHHRVQKFAITTITDGKPINRSRKPIHPDSDPVPVFPATCSCFTTGKDAKKLITCVILVWKNVSSIDFLPVHILQVSFRHCRPHAASQITRRKDKYSTNLHNPKSYTCQSFERDPPNRVTFWQVSFGMLWTVSQVYLTGFTTYAPVKAPVKLTNWTIFAPWKS